MRGTPADEGCGNYQRANGRFGQELTFPLQHQNDLCWSTADVSIRLNMG